MTLNRETSIYTAHLPDTQILATPATVAALLGRPVQDMAADSISFRAADDAEARTVADRLPGVARITTGLGIHRRIVEPV